MLFVMSLLVSEIALAQFYPTGLVVPDDWEHSAMRIRPAVRFGSLPETFDWRETAPGKTLTPIRNQGSCGSCWAFSTAATVADAIHIKDNKPALDLSEQWLVSCNSERYGCNGGWYVFNMYQAKGSVYEIDYSYTGTDSACKSGLTYHEKLESYAFVDSDSSVPTVDQIKAAIYNYGPISVAVNASSAMQSYRSGVFKTCENGGGVNHAVNLIGWNDKEGYWLMRNSWGTTWGEKGFMKIKYGCNQIGYAASVVTYGSACEPQPFSFAGKDRIIKLGEKTKIGMTSKTDTTYQWDNSDSLSSSSESITIASPKKTTVYTLSATTKCGTAKHSVKVGVFE
jgi:hypothetical protein